LLRQTSRACKIDAELARLVKTAGGKMEPTLMEWLQRRTQVLRKLQHKSSDL